MLWIGLPKRQIGGNQRTAPGFPDSDRVDYTNYNPTTSSNAISCLWACALLEVESLLSAHGKAGDFIEAGPLGVAADRTSVAAAQPLTGRQLGHYQILSRLGEGGMGIIYKARGLFIVTSSRETSWLVKEFQKGL